MVGSLDDPLGKYVQNFTIKNPLGKEREPLPDGGASTGSGDAQFRVPSVTLRRMAGQLSGEC